MGKKSVRFGVWCVAAASLAFVVTALAQSPASQIGKEVAIPKHLKDGQEFQMSIQQLIAFGQKLFTAKFTVQEGEGRPLSKGTGAPLSDPTSPLVFPRNFDRLSGPDSNSCSGCHVEPRPGGGGDRATEVFVLGQRFDHVTFDHNDLIPTRGAVDELGNFVILDTVADERKTIGMFGSGFLEMVARQMTADLQAERDATPPGSSSALVSKGVAFGIITHNMDGSWDTSQVVGISPVSLRTSAANPTPSLVIRPYAQSSNVVSIREFTNNAMNHHHGMQSEERFGLGADEDGDGFVNEITVADMTAISMFQATLPAPGRVISTDPTVQQAILNGEQLFNQIGCASCHSTLPLTADSNPGLPGQPGWIYFEPDPYNPNAKGDTNLQLGPTNYPFSAPALTVDLTSSILPQPRLHVNAQGFIAVPAYTDLKIHDITTGPGDPNAEPLDQNQPAGTAAFFAGNTKFITRKLWGLYNSGPFMHNGKFTTMREAIENHNGEALTSHQAFDALTDEGRNDVIEFLKSLQVLPAGTTSAAVDQNGHAIVWPPMQQH